MPELPEVETVVRGLREPLIGRTIVDAWYTWEGTIANPPAAQFIDRIREQRIKAIRRRAKYIICELSDDFLVVHLKMTGRLYVAANNMTQEADRWVRCGWQLDNQTQLRFSDSRKFGKEWLLNDLSPILEKLGPEPLEDDFTVEIFRARLAGRQRHIKPLLLDQSFIAGVGNIYADEALHRAGIHPLRRASTLSDDEITRLYAMIRATLQDGIQHEGASINWYRKPDGTTGESQKHFYVYGREDEPCRHCGTLIVKTRVGQRGTHYCPNCQKAPEER